MNIFLTGDIGVGKTTVLLKVLEFLNCKIGGYLQIKEKTEDKMAFKLINLNNGKASELIYARPDISQKELNIKAFDSFGGELIKSAVNTKDVVVLDEIGFLERDSYIFKESVKTALDSNCIVLGVIKKRKDEFLDEIKNHQNIQLIEVTEMNREFIVQRVVEMLKEGGLQIKKNGGFFSHKRRVDWYNESLENPQNDYPLKIVQYIRERIDQIEDKKILEIGAGSGALAIPLLEEKANITTVDSSVNMFLSLYNRKEDMLNKSKNLEMKLGPWESYDFETHDVVISAFCSNNLILKENFERLLSQAREKIFIIIHSFRNRRNFGRNELMKKLGREQKLYAIVGEDIINILKEKGLNYHNCRTELKIDQFFNEEEEAHEFIRDHFNIKGEIERDLTEQFVNERLIKLSNGYVLQNTKYVDVIEIII